MDTLVIAGMALVFAGAFVILLNLAPDEWFFGPKKRASDAAFFFVLYVFSFSFVYTFVDWFMR